MRNFIQMYPSLVFLAIGFILIITGDAALSSVIILVYLLGKIEKTTAYGVLKNKLQKLFCF